MSGQCEAAVWFDNARGHLPERLTRQCSKKAIAGTPYCHLHKNREWAWSEHGTIHKYPKKKGR